jgi:hypothetical protein
MNRGAFPALRKQFLVGIWEETAGIMRMVTELLPFMIWYSSLTQTQTNWFRNLGILGLILFSSHYLTRLMHHLKWKIGFQGVVVFAWMLICILGGLKILIFPGQPISFWDLASSPVRSIWLGVSVVESIHTILTLLLVWRGVFLTRHSTRPSGVIGSFQIGLIFFIIFGLLHPFNELDFIVGSFFAFIITGLIGLSTSRIAEQSEIEEARLPAMSPRWAAGLLIAIAGIVSISYVITNLVSRFLVEPIAFILRLALQIFADIFFLVTSPLLFALLWMIEKIVELMNTGVIANLINLAQDLGNFIQNLVHKPILSIHINFRAIFWILLILGVVAIIIISLRWKPWKRAIHAEADAEELVPEIRMNRILNWLQKLRIPTSWINPGRFLAAARIRRIYAQLLKLCKNLDKPRPPASTPLEFLPTMRTLFPENHEDLKSITHSYLKIRYGDLPESRNEVEEVEIAWKRIKLSARKLQAILRLEKQRKQ